MPETTPAAVLRAAADKIRTLAEAATDGPWLSWGLARHVESHGVEARPGSDGWARDVAATGHRPDADWIAAVHPGVGLALADWLDAAAREYDPDPDVIQETDASHAYPLAVARAILAGSRT